jgi:hypothetical protein
MRLVALVVTSAFLVACGGGGGGGKAEVAAKACDAYAKTQLGDKTYQLDTAVLAKSMTAPQADGTQTLESPIVIEPGTASESKQKLECAVRFTDGKAEPDILRMQFIW